MLRQGSSDIPVLSAWKLRVFGQALLIKRSNIKAVSQCSWTLVPWVYCQVMLRDWLCCECLIPRIWFWKDFLTPYHSFYSFIPYHSFLDPLPVYSPVGKFNGNTGKQLCILIQCNWTESCSFIQTGGSHEQSRIHEKATLLYLPAVVYTPSEAKKSSTNLWWVRVQEWTASTEVRPMEQTSCRLF